MKPRNPIAGALRHFGKRIVPDKRQAKRSKSQRRRDIQEQERREDG